MERKIGAHWVNDNTCEFTVWAPLITHLAVDIVSPENKSIPLKKDQFGYWSGHVNDVPLGSEYFYSFNGQKRPDPAAQFQPDVHGPSQIVHHHFLWEDENWKGLPLKEMIIYELHTGTFTEEGTFEGIIPKLDYLLDLGINAIEIMPIAQFPGSRNWGYDGVFPFAPQATYGGVDGLKRLVNACHKKGLAIVLDVVYNHLGPEGNYLNEYGPYFTDKYSTPWGKSLNFDDAYCDGVRNFFIQNAKMWLKEYHIDALRLDAVHAIKDLSAKHFLQQLSEAVAGLSNEVGRELVLIAECDLNDPKFINPIEKNGYGLTGQWVDEFHHSLHSVVTGETDGYYADFGKLEHLRKAFQETFVYTGNYSEHRKKNFGAYPKENPYSQFVVFAQNHDHIGNRMLGDRISHLLSFEALKLTAATYFLSPYVPMLFMGEEYGEENPFMYFISHTDKTLVEAVRNGRKKEFENFNWQGEVPDPQAEEVFQKCKLNWYFTEDNKKTTLFNFYKTLIHFRKRNPSFKIDQRGTLEAEAFEDKGLLVIRRFEKPGQKERVLLYAIFNFSTEDSTPAVNIGPNTLFKAFDSSDQFWLGAGSKSQEQLRDGEILSIRKHSVVVYEQR
jgi:maltooligosyltrehalose trehalohydrolase